MFSLVSSCCNFFPFFPVHVFLQILKVFPYFRFQPGSAILVGEATGHRDISVSFPRPAAMMSLMRAHFVNATLTPPRAPRPALAATPILARPIFDSPRPPALPAESPAAPAEPPAESPVLPAAPSVPPAEPSDGGSGASESAR